MRTSEMPPTDLAGQGLRRLAPEQRSGDEVSNTQLDLFKRWDRSDVLDAALWSRHQDRREIAAAKDFGNEDVPLVSLIMALARLSAQRDARLIATARVRN